MSILEGSVALLLDSDDLRRVIPLISFTVPTLVAHDPYSFPNKIRTPVCMPIGPQHDIACRPARLANELRRKR